jgi:hypothetical protein
MPATYVPWKEKHKPPRGFGTWCPAMPEGRAQQLLEQAIGDPDPQSNSTKRYAVDGDWCFVANPTRVEQEIYHGYPVTGSEMPDRVLKKLEELGRITAAQRARLRKQSVLPDGY